MAIKIITNRINSKRLLRIKSFLLFLVEYCRKSHALKVAVVLYCRLNVASTCAVQEQSAWESVQGVTA